jgi:hypothetical protein
VAALIVGVASGSIMGGCGLRHVWGSSHRSGYQRIRGCPVTASYTAVIQQSGDWWIGWVEEVPGVNSQGKTREELMENLHSALQEALQMNL